MNRETAGRILPENDNYEKLRRYWAAEVAKMDFPALAKRFDIPETVRLPIDPSYAERIDSGAAEAIEIPEFESFAARILAK